MSRIGKKIITIPEGVTAEVNGDKICVRGKLGEIDLTKSPLLAVNVENNIAKVEIAKKTEHSDAQQGLFRVLLFNAIEGVSKGFEKRLEIIGVGYRAAMQGNDILVSVGYSHPVEVTADEGINFKVEKNTIVINGISKELVGNIAAKIRDIRPPEPYKGKGIKYKGEFIVRKAGKAGKAGAK